MLDLAPEVLDGLRLRCAGGLTMDIHPTLFADEEAAHEDAKNRLLVWLIARQIRIDRCVAEDEVVRVTLRDQSGDLLFGDVVWLSPTT